jgi:TrmH family RNA methyltransferase
MLSNNEIKFLRSLQLKKCRDKEQLIFVEGWRIIKDILHQHSSYIVTIYVAKNFEFQNEIAFANTISIDAKQVSQISSSKAPQGIFATLKFPEFRIEAAPFTLVLDGVQDPGNMGTILRTAAWFDVKNIVCSLDTVDVCNPKVVQATMGIIYDLNIFYTDLPVWISEQERKTDHLHIYGALMDGKNAFQEELQNPALLIMGNEGNGIRPEVEKFVNQPITIPKKGVGESLNVAVAASILLGRFCV